MAKPVLVVSPPRAGSTFVVALLDSHPQVKMTNELSWLTFLRKTFLLASTPSSQTIDDGEGFKTAGILPERHTANFAYSYLAMLRPFVGEVYGRIVGGVDNVAFFGDKVLSHNDLAFALEHFAEAAFVQLVRDPRDVLASTFAFSDKQAMVWDQSDFRVRVDHIERFLRVTHEQLASREHFFVRYEDLMADVERHTRRLFAFLELPVTAEVEAFLHGAAQELFAQHGTSTSPAASIGRWRRDLSPEQQRIATEAFAESLQRLGYAV